MSENNVMKDGNELETDGATITNDSKKPEEAKKNTKVKSSTPKQVGWLVQHPHMPDLALTMKDAQSEYEAIAVFNERYGIIRSEHRHIVSPVY